jgi:hypothetical protein
MLVEAKKEASRKKKVLTYKKTAKRARKTLRKSRHSKDWNKDDLKGMIQWKQGPFFPDSEPLSKLKKGELVKLWKKKYSKRTPPAIKWTGTTRKSTILLFIAIRANNILCSLAMQQKMKRSFRSSSREISLVRPNNVCFHSGMLYVNIFASNVADLMECPGMRRAVETRKECLVIRLNTIPRPDAIEVIQRFLDGLPEEQRLVCVGIKPAFVMPTVC